MIFLRFLLITICIMWLIRMIARVVLPMIFQSLMNKAQNHTEQQHQYKRPYTNNTKEPIRVDFIPPKDKEAKAADKAGEFVDFEEIK